MKKKGAAYGLFDGLMYPFFRCSQINFSSAPCSGLVKVYIFPGIVLGAPSFKSMVWSHIRKVGNHCDSFSLNTLVWGLYLRGRLIRFCRGFSSFLLTKIALCASLVLITIGSWS